MSGAVTLQDLADRRFIRLTTFRRTGEPVHTVVWHVVIDDALYVHTGDQTGKAKRLRANGRAEVAWSDARGREVGDPVPASGAAVNGSDASRLEAAFKDKYGLLYRLVRLTSGFRRKKIGETTHFRIELDDLPGQTRHEPRDKPTI